MTILWSVQYIDSTPNGSTSDALLGGCHSMFWWPKVLTLEKIPRKMVYFGRKHMGVPWMLLNSSFKFKWFSLGWWVSTRLNRKSTISEICDAFGWEFLYRDSFGSPLQAGPLVLMLHIPLNLPGAWFVKTCCWGGLGWLITVLCFQMFEEQLHLIKKRSKKFGAVDLSTFPVETNRLGSAYHVWVRLESPAITFL